MSKSTLDRLLEQLTHPEYAVRKAATEHLIALGSFAVPRLLDTALGSTHPTAQVRAIEALGKIGDFRALGALAKLELSYDLDVSLEAARARNALGKLPLAVQIEQLTTLLAQESEAQPLAALAEHALRIQEELPREAALTLRHRFQSKVLDPSDPWRSRFIAAVARLDAFVSERFPSSSLNADSGRRPYLPLPDDAEGLIRILSSSDYAIRVAATAKLALLGEEALAPLAHALTLSSYLPRLRMIEALGKLQTPKALPLLNEAWRQHEGERGEVLKALVHLAPLIEKEPLPELADSYIELIRLCRYDTKDAARAGARALVKLAELQPLPRYRAAIPLLKPRFLGAPLELTLIFLGRELDQLTAQWKDLPLAAEAPTTPQTDLPLPAKDQEPK